MLGELLKDIADSVNDLRHGQPTRTITVARPYCTPCRGFVMTALQPYGVKIYGYDEHIRFATPFSVLGRQVGQSGDLNKKLPVANVARVTVSAEAAVWAEYLLMRQGQLKVVPPYQNKRNQQWAAGHGGQMPPQWEEGKPWIEKSCKAGVQAWQSVKEAAKQSNKKGAKVK